MVLCPIVLGQEFIAVTSAKPGFCGSNKRLYSHHMCGVLAVTCGKGGSKLEGLC